MSSVFAKIFAVIAAIFAWIVCMEAPIFIILYIWNYNPTSYLSNIAIGYISSAVGAFFAAQAAEKISHLGETVVSIVIGAFAIFWIGQKVLLIASPEVALMKIVYLVSAVFAIVSFHLYSKLHN